MIEYFKEGDLRSPASETEISQLERDLGFGLPADYREFLLLSDGYNGDVGAKGYAQLWSVRELTANNEGYEVGSWVPELTLIGSNGGPTAYGIDRQEVRASFVSIPFVPMARDEIRPLGGTFVEFLAALSSGEGW
jgi:cell wall assembly regulator SMI1